MTIPSRLARALGRDRRPKWTPPSPEQRQAQWIDCVLSMVANGPDEHSGYMSAHYVFQVKVLGRPKMEALKIAARVQDHPLDRETCEHIAAEWMKCAICEAEVADGEDDLCPSCAEEVEHAA